MLNDQAPIKPVMEQVRTFPKVPGVYLMKDDAGRVLYVGKAKDLRSRVSSYFQPSADLLNTRGPEIARMVTQVVEIDFLELIERTFAGRDETVGVGSKVRLDAIERESPAHTAQDQIRRAIDDAQEIAAMKLASHLESIRASFPREDLEQLLVGLSQQRISHFPLGEYVHCHEDLALESPRSHPTPRFRHHRQADLTATHQEISQAFVDQVRADRQRVTIS